jgi:hypothetical protein
MIEEYVEKFKGERQKVRTLEQFEASDSIIILKIKSRSTPRSQNRTFKHYRIISDGIVERK